MTHIPSAAPPREVTGGAPTKQTTSDSPSNFIATLEASLLTTLTTQDARSLELNAQEVRSSAHESIAAQHGAGVTRLATITELASAELATSTYQPPQQDAPPVKALERPAARSDRSAGQNPTQAKGQAAQGQVSTGPSDKGAEQAAAPKRVVGTPEAPSAQTAPRLVGAGDVGVKVQTQQVQQVVATTGARVAPAGRAASGPVAGRVGAASRSGGMMPGKAQAVKAPPSPHVLRHAKAFQAQLVKGLAAALKRQGASITLNLRPRSLGRLTIELSVRGQSVDARIQATTEAARGLLESASVDLRESLASRGLTLQRLDVEIADTNDESPVHDQTSDTNHHRTTQEDEARDQSGSSPADDAHVPENDGHVVALGLDVTV